jgi:hypothetical protein
MFLKSKFSMTCMMLQPLVHVPALMDVPATQSMLFYSKAAHAAPAYAVSSHLMYIYVPISFDISVHYSAIDVIPGISKLRIWLDADADTHSLAFACQTAAAWWACAYCLVPQSLFVASKTDASL